MRLWGIIFDSIFTSFIIVYDIWAVDIYLGREKRGQESQSEKTLICARHCKYAIESKLQMCQISIIIPILQTSKVKMRSYSLAKPGFSADSIHLSKYQGFSFEMRNDQGKEMDDGHNRL